jgi:hypothetical protein
VGVVGLGRGAELKFTTGDLKTGACDGVCDGAFELLEVVVVVETALIVVAALKVEEVTGIFKVVVVVSELIVNTDKLEEFVVSIVYITVI